MSAPQESDGLRQGDWLTGVVKISIEDFTGNVRHEVETPLGVAVVTQCCDLAQDRTGMVQLAPVVELTGEEHSGARSGRTSRYAQMDDSHFADLAVVGTFTRDSSPTGRLTMSTARRQQFADCISRRFSRFAFPDEIVKVLNPLKRKIRDTAAKAGHIGAVMDRVVTMRLECEPDWDEPSGIGLTLLVLVSPESLPSIDGLESRDVPVALAPKQMRKQGLSGAAEAILRCEHHDHRLTEAWDEFGEELLKLLQKGMDSAPAGYVDDVQVEILRTDELSYERFRNTVDLDFDYLSPPPTDTPAGD